MRKTLAIMFTALLVLVGCSSNDTDESKENSTSSDSSSVRLRIAHDSSNQHPSNVALEKFKENVEKETDGKIEVELFPASQLGDATEIMEQVRRGDLEMGLGASTHFTNLIPKLAIWESFYLFDDSEHAAKVLDGEAGKKSLEALNDHGLQGLGFMEIGFRNFSNSKRPLEKVEDFKGLKIRGYNPLQIKAWESLGVSLTNLSWQELFTSLQQNLIDGQESSTTSFADEKFYEAQDFWSLTMHVYTNYLWYANNDFMDGLDDDQKEIILQEVEKAIALERELMNELEVTTLDSLAEHNVEVNEVSLEEREKMGEKMNSAIKEDIVEQTGEAFYNEMMELIDSER